MARALNLGGIANVTVATEGPVLAWDVGPANALVDAFVDARSSGRESMDVDGGRASRGQVSADLLDALLDDPYFALPAPKSTGKEVFNLGYVEQRLSRLGQVADDDVVATLVELTAVTVASACHDHGVREVVAAGGGTRNPVLMARLAARCAPTTVTTIDALGVPSQAKEALAFALLGFLTVHGLAGTVPSATGARAASVLGSITPGREALRLPEPAADAPQRLVVVPA